MRSRLIAAGLAVAGLITALIAALAIWRRPGRSAVPAADAGRLRPAALPPPAPPLPRVPNDLELHPTGVFAALGRFDYRFRRVVPVIGLLLMIGLQVWASQAGGRLIQGGWVIEGSEEQRAADLLADRFGTQATTMLVILEDPEGDAASPAFQEVVSETLQPIADEPLVDEITTYADSPVDELLRGTARRRWQS